MFEFISAPAAAISMSIIVCILVISSISLLTIYTSPKIKIKMPISVLIFIIALVDTLLIGCSFLVLNKLGLIIFIGG